MTAGRPHRFMPRAPRTRAGFTLIELVAVIVITAIIAVVALPSMGAIADARTGGAARTLAGVLAYARETALNGGSRTWVAFDGGNNSCRVLIEPDGGTGYADAGDLVDPRTGKPLGLRFGEGEFAGVSLQNADFDGDATVGFDWLGTPITTSLAALVGNGHATLSGGIEVRVQAGTGDVGVVLP